MKIHTIAFLAALLAMTACQSPEKKAASELARVAKARDASEQTEGEIVNHAKGPVFAAGLALAAETNRSLAVVTAASLNQRAQAALGLPSATEAVEWEAIVRGLLHSNAAQRAQGAAMLAAKDGQIARLEAQLKRNGATLARAEASRDRSFLTVAREAGTWRRIKWAAGLVGGCFLFLFLAPIALRFLGIAIGGPGGGMLAGFASSAVGALARRTFAAVPEALSKAGVVAEQAHIKMSAAAEDMARAIAKAKEDPAAWGRLKPVLQKLEAERKGTAADTGETIQLLRLKARPKD